MLTRIRDEVVEVYARPLWDNPEELARLIDQRLAQVESERRHEAVSRKKAEAEQAFRSRDYHKAAPLHGQLDESQLSLIDRKRDAFSKKRAS